MVKDRFKFKTGYEVQLSLTDTPTQIVYTFYDANGEKESTVTSGLPLDVGERSDLIKHLKDYIGADRKNIKNELRKVRKILNKKVLELQGEAEIQRMQEQQDHELEIRKRTFEAGNFLKNLQDPILYIGSIIDWLTAGERINTLICFTAGCSQLILHRPISVIGYGESASGKTYVQQAALSLLPEDFVIVEKKTREAALFNRSQVDKYFYDGKIVSYGDMGGSKDRENQQETLDLMKELQTDGRLVKPVSVKGSDNNWVTEELELIGTPSVWYTTVPTEIDQQELSRAILFSARMDNRDIFNKRGKALSLKRGRTYNSFLSVEEEAEMIPYMILHLRDVMDEYIVINPYFDIITDILSNSQTYKRDTEKYTNLLETITALNFYQNEKYVFDDGQKAVITSKNDVQLLLSMLEPYMASIMVNVKPKSVEIYDTIRKNIDDWKQSDESGMVMRNGITARFFYEEVKPDISDRSVSRYFSDLYHAGLLRRVERTNEGNVYDIVKFDFDNVFDDLNLDEVYDFVKSELGQDIADIVKNDILREDLSILDKHDLVGEPSW